MNSNEFKISYELTARDYMDFNFYHLNNSKSMKKLVFTQRFIIPLFYFAFPFILSRSTNISFMNWMLMSVGLYILWVWTSPRKMQGSITKKINKALKEGKLEKLLGEHTITLNDEGIVDSGKGGEAKAPWNSIYDVTEGKDHVYIFINDTKAYIIPNRAFVKEQLKHDFLAKIKEKRMPMGEQKKA